MSASTKLSNAVKALCFLSEVYPRPKSSSEISDYTGVNASKLRKILSMLVKQNIVESIKGSAGGFILRKDPKSLHLQEIYCAVEEQKAFHLDVSNKNGNAAKISSTYNEYFLSLFSDIQIEIEEKMRRITLDSISREIGITSSYK